MSDTDGSTFEILGMFLGINTVQVLLAVHTRNACRARRWGCNFAPGSAADQMRAAVPWKRQQVPNLCAITICQASVQ